MLGLRFQKVTVFVKLELGTGALERFSEDKTPLYPGSHNANSFGKENASEDRACWKN